MGTRLLPWSGHRNACGSYCPANNKDPTRAGARWNSTRIEAIEEAKSPAAVLLSALRSDRLEPRSAEALPWLVATFPDLDWDWLVPRVKTQDLQNKLGFVVTLARQLAELTNAPAVGVLREQEDALARSRLVREDVFGRTTLTEAEKRWLRAHRPPEASHWNVLSSLTAKHLRRAG
jgi:hypothetical protein